MLLLALAAALTPNLDADPVAERLVTQSVKDRYGFAAAHQRPALRERAVRPSQRPFHDEVDGKPRCMRIGATALRTIIGTLFVGHGTQKLFGWFEGHGLEGTGGFFESLGLRPGRRNAMAAGLTETVGGAMLTAGALTPIAAAALNGTMLTATRTAHKGKGPWVTGGGWEYNLVLMAAVTALAENGPGAFSVDESRFGWMKGPLAAAFAVGAGVAGSYLITDVLNEAAPEPEAEAATDDTRGESGRFARTEQMAEEPAATTLPG